MAAADLLVSFLDLILAQIPIAFREHFLFLKFVPLCNVHAVPLYAATDCSVWFTVAFSFDRCVAICFQKLKTKYCTERMAAVVLGTVTVLSCLKDIVWYFMFTGEYVLGNIPWFCWPRAGVQESPVWTTIEFIHYHLNPLVPFLLVLLFNAVTIRHVLVASSARRRLQTSNNGGRPKDPEMEKRRKSLILLLVVSGNFILLWALFTSNFIWYRLWHLGSVSMLPPDFVPELSFMLQLLSCCTNTALYAVTQTKFRQQLNEMVNYPVTLIVKHMQC
ncbi:cysteinyl leukotriene receptor 1-like [Hypanus sabinus]|uniref:cysteinyl leukotriene receptor 1-like n=1 Tax=Hypanus sabinus TaxID=79690 RepID=UPI0028C41814|nr:cysteinyl leukotriene receptor 1-like [Hypanus sabinus]